VRDKTPFSGSTIKNPSMDGQFFLLEILLFVCQFGVYVSKQTAKAKKLYVWWEGQAENL